MNIFKRVEAMTLKWYEFSYLKASVFFFTLFLVTVWPAFQNLVLGLEWYWWLAFGIITAAPLVRKIF